VHYIVAFLLSFLAGWCFAASEVLFRAEHRPGLFRGAAGMVVLLAFAAAIGLLVVGSALWMFQAIQSSTVLVVMLGGALIGFMASNRLHVNTAGAANRLVIGVLALTLLYGVASRGFP
jgi:hypothetical protein